MLIGGHVSTAGGLVKAHGRGVEFGCDAIQVFNQSPRMWRPTRWKPEDVEAFRALMDDGPIRSVVIHAVYLINCASNEKEVREKSLASLTHSLRMGDAIGADGVVVHPGSLKKEPLDESMVRIVDALEQALADSDRCPLLLENTAGMKTTVGRSFDHLARLVDGLGGHERVGVCLDCCHLFASGYDVRTADALAGVVDEFHAEVGLDRLRCLHVNDSRIPFGGNRDQHANLPEGEMGREALAAFLSEPRFEGLPALLEVPGPDKRGPDASQIAVTRELREEGLAARGGSRRRATGSRAGRTRSKGRPRAAARRNPG
jgi:deoxyribonuclease IV